MLLIIIKIMMIRMLKIIIIMKQIKITVISIKGLFNISYHNIYTNDNFDK